MPDRNIQELTNYLRQTRSASILGLGIALIETAQQAESIAKKKVTENLIGRNNRKLSGRYLNAVFSGFHVPRLVTQLNGAPLRPRVPTFFVGVSGIPYGAIHEFGGTITPKKAKALWLKQWGGKADNFRRMTPTEWWDALKSQKGQRVDGPKFAPRFRNGKMIAAGFEEDGEFTPLFILKESVEIPPRPSIRPAIEEAMKEHPRNAARRVAEILRSNFYKG